MPYNVRRVKEKKDTMFNRTARTMALYVRNTPPSPAGRTDDLFVSDTEPDESEIYSVVYIRGRFVEKVSETYEPGGYERSVSGEITVPMMYRQYLGSATYIDPYLDGSRFKKSGATTVESRSYIIQKIESVSLTSETTVNPQ